MSIASFYLQLFSGNPYRHGGVGYTDIEAILGKMGYFPVSLPSGSGLFNKWRRWKEMNRLVDLIPPDATVASLFPVYPRMSVAMLQKLKRKGVRILFIIGDIDGLKDNDPALLEKELGVMKLADAVVVHTEEMKTWLQRRLPAVPAQVLGPFDFLAPVAERKREKSHQVCFAGNLGKSGFLNELPAIPAIHFHIYGEDLVPGLSNAPNCSVYPAFEPKEGPAVIEGSFGLVWDGDSIETLSGPLGEYAQYIFHHKLSLYILAGMPVIVPASAGSAGFVREKGIGWTIDSLHQLPALIQQVSADEYREAMERMKPIAEAISEGAHLRAAVLNSPVSSRG